MGQAFQSGGVMMYPLLLVGLGVLWLGARTAWALRSGEPDGARVEGSLQTILFWGVMSVVLGLLGTVVGLIQIAQAIGLAGAVEPPLVWGGFGVSLVTLLFGLLIFVVAALTWFGLRQWSLRAGGRLAAN